MKKRDERLGDGPEGGLTHNPFASLRKSDAPDAPEGANAPDGAGAGAPAASDATGATGATGPARRIVVRRERKGRAGKTVTRVSGLGFGSAELEGLARDLKRALGCGASIEDDDVLLQGILTDRAAAWLRQRGLGDVTIGN